jgi:threonine-phosphate decarboxylase
MSGHSHSLAHDFRTDFDCPPIESRLNREHGGAVYAWARKTGLDPAEIIDFSASINPLGPPALARAAFQKSYGLVARYPDPYGEELKEALAKRHGLKADELLLGNGSTQLIYLVCSALQPRNALVVAPAFSEHANALQLARAKVRFLSLTNHVSDFRFSTEQFMAAWRKDDDVAFLTTPNSVTGQLIPKEEIEKIARVALVRKRFLVVDEAFIDFVEAESVKQLIRENPYLIVLRSLTKYYSLPGLRLGYLLAHAQRVAKFSAYLEPWSVNGPAQQVAVACLGDVKFSLKTECWLHRERKFLTHALRKLNGFHSYSSNTNFLLVRMTRDGSVVALRSFLLRKKILIRSCDSFTGLGPDYFRIAIRRRKDNRRLINALAEWAARRVR